MQNPSLCDVAFKMSVLSVRTSLILNIVLLTIGCQKSSPPVPQASANAQVDTQGEVVGMQTNQSTVAESKAASRPDQDAVAVAVVTRIADAIPESPASAQQKPAPIVQKVPIAQKVVAQPNAEQLARWALPSYEPLELMAVRESNKTGFVSSMAVTPDGKHFILAGSKVTLWSATSEQPEHVLFEFSEPGKEQFFRDVAVAPDGKWFAAGDTEGTMRVWSLADRKELISKQLYSDDISQIAISPDSKEISTISWTSEVTVWNAADLKQKHRFSVDATGLKAIKYMSPDVLVAAGETTSSWNTSTGKLRKQLSDGRYNFSLARSVDSNWFAFGIEDALQIWNVAEAKPLAALSAGFANNEMVEFSSDGKFLFAVNGSVLRVWDVANKRVCQVVDVYGSTVVGLNWLPTTELLLVASENGRIRIWGTPKSGEAIGLKRLHTVAVLPEPTSQTPASSSQFLAAIDLRSMPMLPGGVADMGSEFMSDYATPATPDEVNLFYRYVLGSRGWLETDVAGGTPGSISFRKNGSSLAVSTSDAAEGKTQVSLYHAGNVALRKLPKLDAAAIELMFENENVVMYRTKTNLLEIETTLLREMHQAGWTAYSRLNSSYNEQDDQRDLSFIQNGAMLNISIGRAPTDPSSYTVQYGLSLTRNSIPVPQDSGFVEYDGSTQPLLVATTAMNLAQTHEFYDNQLTVDGWLKSEFGRSIEKKYNWLPYVRGQTDLMVGLESLDNGRTRIRIGNDLGNSWQLAESKPKVEPPKIAGSIEAADFPILNESKSAKFDVDNKSIEFQIDATPLLYVAELYEKTFATMGWKPESSGIKADDYVMMTFVNAKAEVTLRARTQDGNAIVNVQGEGLSWVKALPGSQQVISYETWLRRNHQPAGLDLLDEYTAEMNAITGSR